MGHFARNSHTSFGPTSIGLDRSCENMVNAELAVTAAVDVATTFTIFSTGN